ncbi:hypothetical protein SAMN02745121_09098 [Nannocystis exedens]|uniref:Uncharacterized protein n=1 Tax=Nannocystis exedens TaxID=54 RepID=A0A1I2J496_9BACT|nr:hypothetical protein NAEX_02650 [Nannocystis exedens]SFF47561.1 hypothetical protein SAMN02745121_09098 [Nannocystis exedens]
MRWKPRCSSWRAAPIQRWIIEPPRQRFTRPASRRMPAFKAE